VLVLVLVLWRRGDPTLEAEVVVVVVMVVVVDEPSRATEVRPDQHRVSSRE